jgi:hypothetical protein
MHAHSYCDNDPTAHGYTANHLRFGASKDAWLQKASVVRNIRGGVPVRVHMGMVKQGQGSIAMIGVSP